MKIAVVGTGTVAIDNYIPYLASLPDVEMAFSNRTRAKAEAAAMKFGGPVFDTAAEIAVWQPTAALVLTGETTRFEAAMALIEAGVPKLFFEKPLTARNGQAHVSEDDFHRGKEMIEAAARMGCETAMVFNYRFFDQTIAARNIVASRNFGQLISATGLTHYACWSHTIDLLHCFACSPVAEVTALAGNRALGDGEAQDITASLRMENGAIATLIGTGGLTWQHPLYELTLVFERGRVHMRDLDGALEVLDGAAKTMETITLVRDTSRWDQYKASFGKSLAAYLDSLRAGQPPPVPGIDGLRELQTEAAMRRSIALKRPVNVREELPI